MWVDVGIDLRGSGLVVSDYSVVHSYRLCQYLALSHGIHGPSMKSMDSMDCPWTLC